MACVYTSALMERRFNVDLSASDLYLALTLVKAPNPT